MSEKQLDVVAKAALLAVYLRDRLPLKKAEVRRGELPFALEASIRRGEQPYIFQILAYGSTYTVTVWLRDGEPAAQTSVAQIISACGERLLDGGPTFVRDSLQNVEEVYTLHAAALP